MISVRKTTPPDAPGILRLAAVEPLFNREDREVVEELLLDYLEETEPGDYRFLTAIDGGVPSTFEKRASTSAVEGSSTS